MYELEQQFLFILILTLSLADASKLSSRVKGDLPGKEKEIKSDFKLKAEEANQRLESTVCASVTNLHQPVEQCQLIFAAARFS